IRNCAPGIRAGRAPVDPDLPAVGAAVSRAHVHSELCEFENPHGVQPVAADQTEFKLGLIELIAVRRRVVRGRAPPLHNSATAYTIVDSGRVDLIGN
ncbi:MAG: hypothetical protein B7Z66_15805, partial [Chromatiales bacterium 21-64-14]